MRRLLQPARSQQLPTIQRKSSRRSFHPDPNLCVLRVFATQVLEVFFRCNKEDASTAHSFQWGKGETRKVYFDFFTVFVLQPGIQFAVSLAVFCHQFRVCMDKHSLLLVQRGHFIHSFIYLFDQFSIFKFDTIEQPVIGALPSSLYFFS